MRVWMFGSHADPSRDEASRQAWLDAYRAHNAAVREFFASRPGQYMEFDPTREPDWQPTVRLPRRPDSRPAVAARECEQA